MESGDTMSDSEGSRPNAGWYRDPTGHGDARYWTGAEWSDAVSRGGTTTSIPIPPDLRSAPPVPGTEYVAPAAAPPSQVPSPHVMVVRGPGETPERPAPRRSPFAPLLGALLLAAAVVALIVVLVNSGADDDDEPTEPPPTEQPPDGETPVEPVPDDPGGEPAGQSDATTPSDGSG